MMPASVKQSTSSERLMTRMPPSLPSARLSTETAANRVYADLRAPRCRRSVLRTVSISTGSLRVRETKKTPKITIRVLILVKNKKKQKITKTKGTKPTNPQNKQ
jgi:hypothetical protein